MLDLVALGIALVALLVLVVLVMFLPAMVELAKPMDAGPRLIPDGLSPTVLASFRTPFPDLESEMKSSEPLAVRLLLLDYSNIEAQFI